MPVMRISVLKPLPGRAKEIEHLSDELGEWLSKQPGFILGFRFGGAAHANEVGRISIWESRQHADHAASLDHTVSLRSRIVSACAPQHLEHLDDVMGDIRYKSK